MQNRSQQNYENWLLLDLENSALQNCKIAEEKNANANFKIGRLTQGNWTCSLVALT